MLTQKYHKCETIAFLKFNVVELTTYVWFGSVFENAFEIQSIT